MKYIKQLSLTLALLITAAAGAWAQGTTPEPVIVTINEAKIGTTEYATLGEAISSAQDGDIIQLQSDVALATKNNVGKGITIDFNGYIISRAENTKGGIWWAVDMTFIDSDDTGRGGMKCGYGKVDGTEAKANLCGGRYDETAETILTGTNASFYNIPTSYEIVNINAGGSADADGFKSRVIRNYLDDTKTVATIPMPANDVTVNYTLVRDMQDQANLVTFSGLPTGDGLIVKKVGDNYQFITTPGFQLIDPLISGDNKNIINADGLTVTVEKKNANNNFGNSSTLADFLADAQPGTYKLKAVPKDETSPYEGTVYSSEFTVVEQYDLTVKPADDFSKGKIESVTVGDEQPITPDANGEATKTRIAPNTDVKIKAIHGYIIEKVKTRKQGSGKTFVPGATVQELSSYVEVENNKDGTITLHMPTLNPSTYNVTNSNFSNGENTLHFGYEIGSGTDMSDIGENITVNNWSDHTPFSELDKTIDITSGKPRVAIVITGHVQSATCPAPGKEHYWGLYRYTNPVKVTYNLGGGSVSGSTADKVEYLFSGDALATTFAAPTREGYTFDGWYTSAEGGTKLTASNATSATTIYAHWNTIAE